MRSLPRDNFGRVRTKPKLTNKTAVHVSSWILDFFNSPLNFWKVAGCSGLIFFNQILMEKHALQNWWFFIRLWRLLVPFCAVLSGISQLLKVISQLSYYFPPKVLVWLLQNVCHLSTRKALNLHALIPVRLYN